MHSYYFRYVTDYDPYMSVKYIFTHIFSLSSLSWTVLKTKLRNYYHYFQKYKWEGYFHIFSSTVIINHSFKIFLKGTGVANSFLLIYLSLHLMSLWNWFRTVVQLFNWDSYSTINYGSIYSTYFETHWGLKLTISKVLISM